MIDTLTILYILNEKRKQEQTLDFIGIVVYYFAYRVEIPCWL